MIIASPKPFAEIAALIESASSLLVVGCAGCTAVSLTGGQKEVDQLASDIEQWWKGRGVTGTVARTTIERQCEPSFVAELDRLRPGLDAVLSLGCGAGVQLIAERCPELVVLPALNTLFIGVHRDVGWYEENCRCCGDCQLAHTGGICPVVRCGKGLLNGPCGGTRANGGCELGGEVRCGWYEIYERLAKQGRLAELERVRMPMSWQARAQGTLVLEAYRSRR